VLDKPNQLQLVCSFPSSFAISVLSSLVHILPPHISFFLPSSPPQPDLSVLASRSSQKYASRHFLDFDDWVVEGFFDSGRRQFNSLAEFKKMKIDKLFDQEKLQPCVREVLVVDLAGLKSVVENAQKAVRRVVGLYLSCLCCSPQFAFLMCSSFHLVLVHLGEYQRAQLLSLFVDSVFGGRTKDVEALTLQYICQSFQSSKQTHAIVNLSSLVNLAGVCRHRSLLFKYLADHSVRFPAEWGVSTETLALPIRSRLIRGDQGDGPHAWNVVSVENKPFLLDVMQDPYTLHDVLSTRVCQFDYHRIVTDNNGKVLLLSS
jgi:hypothetical protein